MVVARANPKRFGKKIGVTVAAAFGGQGVYRRHAMFAIVHAGRVYFKVDSSLRAWPRPRL